MSLRDVYWATRCKECNRRGATRHLVSRSQTPESASKPVLCVDCVDVWRAEGRPEAAALLPHGSYNAYRKKAGNDKQKTYEGILDETTGYFANRRRRLEKTIEKQRRALQKQRKNQEKERQQHELHTKRRLKRQVRELKKLSMAELRAELDKRGLPHVGKKAELQVLLIEIRKLETVTRPVEARPLVFDRGGGSVEPALVAAPLLGEEDNQSKQPAVASV